jgi:hypothetical protein
MKNVFHTTYPQTTLAGVTNWRDSALTPINAGEAEREGSVVRKRKNL